METETETEIEAPARPDGLPDEFWDAEAGRVRLDELVGAYGTLASAEKPPASPEDYALELDGLLGGPDAEAKPVLRLAGRRRVSASAWLDPSFGRRDKGDACVLAAVFTDEDGRRLLHRVAYLYYDPKNGRDGAAKQLCRQAAAHARKLLLPVVHVESNGMGAWIPKILERELAREGHGATVIGIPNSRPKHERILEAFDAPLAANALWAHASVFKSPFLRELREWRPENRNGPDDGLDAAACALLAEPDRIRRLGRAPRLEWREHASPGRARTDFRI